MMDLLNLLLGVFKCNHMYYIKDFFSIHIFVKMYFLFPKAVVALLNAVRNHFRQHELFRRVDELQQTAFKLLFIALDFSAKCLHFVKESDRWIHFTNVFVRFYTDLQILSYQRHLV